MDDQTRHLVQRALDKDRMAVDALFERYRTPLRNALRRLIGPRYRLLMADSEDATQDAILSALARLQQFEYRGDGSFLAWLLRGAEYEILRRIRALDTAKRNPGALGSLDHTHSPEPAAPDLSASHVAGQKELADQVREALQLLPAKEREAIILKRYMELDIEEVTAELGLPTPGATRALLSRAQARLSGILARGQAN